ncbi:glycosyltransferase family 4 protein [Nocardioides speluncae]|uniref:glycosyltransferase family 4 protein n=1 Tax=Nocardioides speluncae TaxID=2670337 RepID=UPI00197CD4FC|nr:glycosyltransferase family 4 protein [Nocardioides speluncae]
MSLKTKVKRRVRRGGAAVSVLLPTDQGPESFQRLVGRARVAEARRLLRGLKDYEGAERTVAPLLEETAVSGVVTSRAWALLAETRQKRGDKHGALTAARTAVAARPVAFEARVVHHRLAEGEEQAEALAALIGERPRNRRELDEAFVALRSGDRPSVERYRASLEAWGLHGYDERLAEAWNEIDLVATSVGELSDAVEDAAAYLRWPVPVVARALDRRREWDRLAIFAESHPLPDDAPLVHAKAAGLELRKAATRALTAGYTGAAATLASHALTHRPDDSFAQETWANASDQLAVVRDGWATAERSGQRRYEPREDAVLSVLAQSLPHRSGGYATRSHGVATGLAGLGWDVTGVTRPGFPYDRWSAADTRVVEPADSVDGITYHRLLTSARAYPQYPLRGYVDGFAKGLAKHAREHRAALIHASSFHVNGLAAQAAAAQLGVPFVYEMRGLEELMKVSRDPGFEHSDRYKFLEHLETTICQAADRVFVITAALGRLMESRGVPAEKIVVLPNGVHASQFEPRPRDTSLEAALGVAGKTVIGYAGSLVDYEGLDLLLDAVATLKERRSDFHLVVVGDGHFESTLHRQAEWLDLGDVVTFTGRVPHAEVASYLSLFDIAPFPRQPLPVCEAISPIKPFESMAMGKAVVTSSVAALTEIVADGETGLVFDKDCSTDLARVLERYLDDPALRVKHGEAARAWVRAERDWSSIVKIVDATYRGLLDGPQ